MSSAAYRNEVAEFYFGSNKAGIKMAEKLCTIFTSNGIAVTSYSYTNSSILISASIGEQSRLFREAQMKADGFSHNLECSIDSSGILTLCEPLSRLCTSIWKDRVYEIRRNGNNGIKSIRFASGYARTHLVKYCPFCGKQIAAATDDET